jgi:hypothetical protein
MSGAFCKRSSALGSLIVLIMSLAVARQARAQCGDDLYYVAFSPENPLSENELREKFLGLAAMVLSSGGAQKLFDAIQNIEQIKDTGELAQLLTTDS